SVNAEICHNSMPYDRCSTNNACGCLPISGTDNIGVCGSLRTFCSKLVPCGSSQVCSEPDHICVHHSRCNENPVCYPLSMTNQTICPPLAIKTKFLESKDNVETVAGGNDFGSELNQFKYCHGFFIDKNKNMYITDWGNHRILKWKPNEKQGQVIAGGYGEGYEINQLTKPTGVIFDQGSNSLIIFDEGNKRVIQWFNQNKQEILINRICASSLAIDKYGFLYISDAEKNEVRRWKIGEIKGKKGILVAGGHGKGNKLNQFDLIISIFVDDQQSIYAADCLNNRVMKWKKNATEGIVVAGGNGYGNRLNQLNYPTGVAVDRFGRVYVSDNFNHRIMRWDEGKKEGEIIAGGNGSGNASNQLSFPNTLAFDLDGELYVSDWGNYRIQKFSLNSQQTSVFSH
ncbi:unnamed protein product, partial [Adineta ricciae]